MDINFNNIFANYNPIKIDNSNITFNKESTQANIAENYNNYDTAATVEFQSVYHNINTLNEIQANNIDVKDYKVKVSYLQDFLDAFRMYLDSEDMNGNCITNVLDKYDEIKSNILEYCNDDEKDKKLNNLDVSFKSAAGMIRSMIYFKYYDSKEYNKILENEKNGEENKSDEDILNFVHGFAKDVTDSLINLKNSRDNNYISPLLNMNIDTLSELIKSFFKNPTSIENYFLENGGKKLRLWKLN